MSNGMLTLIVILIIIFLFSINTAYAATTATTEYNYSTGAGVDKWAYEGWSEVMLPDVTAGIESMIYDNIAASDDVREETEGLATLYSFQRFEFIIQEDVTTINQIYYYWEGYGYGKRDKSLYI
jgi:hypothetical protein